MVHAGDRLMASLNQVPVPVGHRRGVPGGCKPFLSRHFNILFVYEIAPFDSYLTGFKRLKLKTPEFLVDAPYLFHCSPLRGYRIAAT
jgi:hypothetical protein